MRSRPVLRALLLIPAVALLAMSPPGPAKRLSVRVSPRVALAPATLVIDAVAERDAANRSLQIEVDSSDYHRSSLIQLDGDDAARTNTVRYDAVPGGTYEVRATLLGADGAQRAEIVEQVRILPIVDR